MPMNTQSWLRLMPQRDSLAVLSSLISYVKGGCISFFIFGIWDLLTNGES